jgi:hypothetical protein
VVIDEAGVVRAELGAGDRDRPTTLATLERCSATLMIGHLRIVADDLG